MTSFFLEKFNWFEGHMVTAGNGISEMWWLVDSMTVAIGLVLKRSEMRIDT